MHALLGAVRAMGRLSRVHSQRSDRAGLQGHGAGRPFGLLLALLVQDRPTQSGQGTVLTEEQTLLQLELSGQVSGNPQQEASEAENYLSYHSA